MHASFMSVLEFLSVRERFTEGDCLLLYLQSDLMYSMLIVFSVVTIMFIDLDVGLCSAAPK